MLIFLKAFTHRALLVVFALFAVMYFTAAAVANTGELKWSDELFTKTTFEEDIKVLLRDVFKRNGNDVFFRKGVEGRVTFEFQNISLRAAVKKLMDEYGLSFSYDEKTNTVTVSHGTSPIDAIFVPKSSQLKDIMNALKRFDLLNGPVQVKEDRKTNSLFLHGEQNAVQDFKALATSIDEAFDFRKQKEKEAWHRSLEKKNIEQELRNAKMKFEVIQLQYANVGSSTTTFQGQTVTLPGILDSLKAFIGSIEVRDEKNQDKAKMDVLAFGQEKKPIVTIDRRTNSVIVQGTEEQIALIKDVVEKLDQQVPLIEIEVMIVDGVANLSEQLGMRWGINANIAQNASNLDPASSVVSTGTVNQIALNPSELTAATETSLVDGTNVVTSSTAATTNTTNNSGVVQLAATAAGFGGGFIYQGTRALLDATLSALATDDQLQTIASPRVVTLNNLTAKITNSNNINFVVTTGDGTKSGIQTVSTGVSLDITPSVIIGQNDGIDLVRMEINAENSSLGAVGTDSVQTDEQEVQTSVVIPEETTFIMGGLFNTSRVEAETGVPGLKNLPLVGKLFRTNTSQKQKRETVFFITPRVFRPDEIKMNLAGQQVRAYINAQKNDLDKAQELMQTESELLDITKDASEDE